MYRGIKIFLVFAILIYILLGVFGCVWLQPEDQTDISQAPEQQQQQEELSPVHGGKLVFSLPGLSSGNPLLVANYEEKNFFSMVYEGLVKYDDQLKITPALAKTWSVDEESKTIVFKLRENVKWHDGEFLSAQDVKFTLDVLRDERIQSVYAEDLKHITRYKVIDDTTLEVTFETGYKDVLGAFTFPVLSSKQYGGVNDILDENADVPLGTGPYRIREYHRRKGFYLERFEGWWKGRPYIDEIEVMLVPDKKSVIATFETGQTDFVHTDAVNSRKYEEAGDINYHKLMTTDYEFLALNFENIALRQREVRQAIAYAIDREEILANILLGHGVIVDTPIPPNCWMYAPTSDKYRYNPGKSTRLLQEAGWRMLGENNIFSKDMGDKKASLTFTLLVNKDNEIRCQVADVIKENLSQVGMQVDVQLLDEEQLTNRLQDKNFDMALVGWNFSPKYNLGFALHSNNIEEGSNFVSYSNVRLDGLLDRLNWTADEDTIKKIYGDIQTLFTEELPYISLYYRTSSLLIKDKIKGVNPVREDQLFDGIEEWYIIPPKDDTADGKDAIQDNST
ncbi:MAG TPA: peptide ABC transporter substrate-binding protein [Clostridiales bacterium]|nr:peptide ABC transporter substrate-binding protein [Clostridiales bacterium]